MSVYLDASVLVALFVIDPASTQADAFLSADPTVVVVSDFGAAEFSSAIARRVRIGDLTRDDARIAFLEFDTWISRSARREAITTVDVGAAAHVLRRLDLNLRTPDAIHLAVAQRLAITLVTFDRGMAAAARAIGIAVAMP